MGLLNIFKRYEVSFLNEKWEIMEENIKVYSVPRIHEIIYLISKGKYYRVANVIHNINVKQEIFIIIEEYVDDYALIKKKS